MQYYVALIADIKGSRKYRAEERGYLQDLTNESLLFANELFKEGIEKEVVFSAGDEVQGLFREPATAFLYYRFLCFLLGPGVLRGGLGVGTFISTIAMSNAYSGRQARRKLACARA